MKLGNQLWKKEEQNGLLVNSLKQSMLYCVSMKISVKPVQLALMITSLLPIVMQESWNKKYTSNTQAFDLLPEVSPFNVCTVCKWIAHIES